MGKIKKKGTSGQAKNYITRTQAVRKLQISLPDFRRLCIFKGIYPREPRSKKKASKTSTPNTTFYYTKDIQYLLHEPLLRKFRDQKAVAKKIARSLGRGEVGDAARLEKNHAPKLTLDHVIKERYPTFIDALRDLDDALSLLFLFANLPSDAHVPPKTIALCQRLCHEFQHYLITTNSLRKSFLSIKGIYYQATIQGQDIMWLVPYRFVQRVNGDVDYRIMATFVDFYTTLLGFVNFRLYSSIGLRYPPKFDTRSDENGAELAAFTLEGRAVGDVPKAIEAGHTQRSSSANKEVSRDIQAKVDKVIKSAGLDQAKDEQTAETTEESSDTIDKFEPAAPEADTLAQPDLSGSQAGSLFAPFTFYISREAPRAPLEFLLRAFGCKRIGWDAVLGDGAFTNDETDPRITHQIVDRPQLPESSLPAIPAAAEEDSGAVQKVKPGTRIPGRTYVQPQWVWDCINEGKLVRPDLYSPGATLPPHLSPWVKPSRGGYDPRASLAEQEEEGEAEMAEDSDEEMEEAADEKSKTASKDEAESESEEDDDDESVDGGMDVAGTDDDESESESEEEDEDFGGFEDDEAASESEDEEEVARTQHQKELEAEAAGLPFSSNGATSDASKKKASQAKKIAAKKRKEEEEIERQKMMMSRKKRKLLEKMMYSNKKQSEEAAKLRSKRRKLEKGAAK
ncbi:mRNA-binding ribosome synthesis protein NOP7 [Aspergillus clavatus NRRL 1]|uniref:Pescadillo homolog n=1 Tax=Aspergillus clavatus (strain ATCC 1007 / CBS 513.65 / DSM 816 / NCTC 3887 / NRRL 1 / QM 1276 / 107) TaxID=344612 RepID=PESC_ASPCL|nr:ribosome biogenesis protein Pescadillo, putative [Aspergillus clavatus NRRL 1]A1CHD1.1 RecName: Full=Pescadillo homolog; AltName: Full=Nucleolar protein 7 homolog [Aspergillus clavatus NRRL 1]EAW10286.1 ribosome biogenesis protein Pescadillo, putative [Aspergillus clavatus NRRL 1]